MAKLHNEAYEIFVRGLNIPYERYKAFDSLIRVANDVGHSLANDDQGELEDATKELYEELHRFSKAHNIKLRRWL